MRVVLPAASGPTRPVTRPGPIRASRESMAGAAAEGKRFVRPSATIRGSSLMARPAAPVGTECAADALPERFWTRVRKRQCHGDGHPLPQPAIRIVDDDAQAVDEISAKLARFDR